jgi:choline dehydrogenase-like flavoprotein
MPQPERYEYLILGGGNGGGFLAWHMARLGARVAVVERRWIGGSCPARTIRIEQALRIEKVPISGHWIATRDLCAIDFNGSNSAGEIDPQGPANTLTLASTALRSR